MGLFDGTDLEHPVLCQQCGDDVKNCHCEPIAEEKIEPTIPPEKQSLRLRVEKRKRGKQMTVIADFRGPSSQRQQFLTELKNLCGAGGTIADDNVEIQGDHLERIGNHLRTAGYRCR